MTATYKLHDENGAPSTAIVGLPGLASHVLSDFRPWAPPGAHHGLAPLLEWMIETGGHAKSSRWRSHHELGHYDKQWRPVVSWMVGSAFCRETIDTLGWSVAVLPVSVLAARRGALGPWAGRVRAAFGAVAAKVGRKQKGLMPDYLAVRATASGGREHAFFEAKGGKFGGITKTPVGKTLNKSLTAWTTQVRNADLRLNGRITSAERWVVATRLHPGRDSSDVVVRRWNVTPRGAITSTGVSPTPAPSGSTLPASPAAVAPRPHASRGTGGRDDDPSGTVFELLSRAMQFRQLGLTAAADVVLDAAEALGRPGADARDRDLSGLSALADRKPTAVGDAEVIPIVAIDLAHGVFGTQTSDAPRLLRVGITKLAAQDVIQLASLRSREQAALRWRSAERPVAPLIVETPTVSIRRDGLVAWPL